MPSRVHFISGLPRSGSTLLAAILKQNPHFHAGVTTPLAPLCATLHQQMGGSGEFAALLDDHCRSRMLRGLFDSYYADIPSGHVVFDTNRTWTARAALAGALYLDSRIICCVREIGWIIDSIERMHIANPLKLSKLFAPHAAASFYARVDALMNSENGLVGMAWSMLREAWFSPSASRLIVVPYDTLVSDPERTVRRLYRELGEPYHSHDFQNVPFEAPEYDDNLGMPGLHTVRTVVERRTRQPVIPPDIFARYTNTHFWADRDLNPRNVSIL